MAPLIRLAALATAFSIVGCAELEAPVFGAAFPMTVPAEKNSLGPRLQQGPDGTTILSWMTRADKGAHLNFAPYFNKGWQDATFVASDPLMFVNWADKPAVTPFPDSTLIAHWLHYSAAATYSYDVLVARSIDGGKTFDDATVLHDDGTKTEHGFVSIYPTDNAGVGIVWLDGRKTGGSGHHAGLENGMTLRAATIENDGAVNARLELDPLVCDCCQTDAIVVDGTPIVVYRDRSKTEVRDIYVTRQLDGVWQEGTPISNDNWVISGCPVNGPEIDALGNNVAVAWFTAANDEPTVKVAYSSNGGASFSDPISIATSDTLGGVEVAMITTKTFAVGWVEKDGDAKSIKIRGVTFDGQLGRPVIAAKSSAERMAPEMVRVDDQLIVAWSDRIGESSKVQTVRVPILGFYDR